VLRRKLFDVEAELRKYAPEIERLVDLIELGGELQTGIVTTMDKRAVSLCIIYARANLVLSTVGSPTGSLPPQRN